MNRALFILLLLSVITSGCRVHTPKTGNDTNKQYVVLNIFGIVDLDVNDGNTTETQPSSQQSGNGWAASFLGFLFVLVAIATVKIYNRNVTSEKREKWQ